MKMHEHDQELIMALAEGTLDDAAAAQAAAEIAACVECSADLELQRFALEALDAAPDVYLTAVESAQLHSALRRELSTTAPPVRRKPSFAWGKWIPVAGLAAAFVFFLALIPGMMSGNSDSAELETVAAAETTAAASSQDFATEAPMAEMAPSDRTADDAGGAMDGTESLEDALAAATTAAPETTAAPAETTTTKVGDESGTLIASLDNLGAVSEIDPASLLDTLLLDVELFTAVSDEARAVYPSFEMCLLETASAEIAPLHGIPSGSEPVIVGLVTTERGEELVLVAYMPEDAQKTVFVTHQVEPCGVVAVLP
jgi:anti-sigma factor RsiW